MDLSAHLKGGLLTEEDEAGVIGWNEFKRLTHAQHYRDGGITSTPCISDVRGKTCPLCNQGWELTTKSFVDQLDHSARGMLLHKSCWLRYENFNEYMLIHDALVEVVLRFEQPETIPNGYGGGYDTDWYLIRILDIDKPAILKFGTRRRVWSLELCLDDGEEWYDSSILEKLMKAENVTHELNGNRFLIHAWTKERLKYYIHQMALAMRGEPKLRDGSYVPYKSAKGTLSKKT